MEVPNVFLGLKVFPDYWLFGLQWHRESQGSAHLASKAKCIRRLGEWPTVLKLYSVTKNTTHKASRAPQEPTSCIFLLIHMRLKHISIEHILSGHWSCFLSHFNQIELLLWGPFFTSPFFSWMLSLLPTFLVYPPVGVEFSPLWGEWVCPVGGLAAETAGWVRAG